MAVPHFSVSIVARGSGRSAVLSAAYRHCARMDFDREARTIDYTRKRDLLHEEFVVPGDAPDWIRAMIADRSAAGASEAFWNRLETFEKRGDAQLAKDVTIALPIELSAAQNIALIREFVAHHVTARGMVADWVYHDAPDNPHVHLMTTLRPLTEGGFGSKRVAVYGIDGQPLRNDAGKIVYELWAGDQSDFNTFRDGWFACQNRHFALAGLDIHVDGRSFEKQGVAMEPTVHIGVGATAIGRKAGSDPQSASASQTLERIAIQDARREENARRIEQDPGLVLDLITLEKSVFDQRDIAKVLNRYIDDPAIFANMLSRVLQHPDILKLEHARISLATGITTPDKFTTRDLIRLEAEMANRALWLHRQHTNGVAKRVLEASFDHHSHLSREQNAAIAHVTKPRRIAAIVGRAGAGKTTMMKAARQAWELGGYRVVGGTLSGKATDGLQKEAGIASRTLAAWELRWREQRDLLDDRTVFVLDEAGMVSSRQMAGFVEAATKAGAKLVLVGDFDQLQPIEAGAAFRAIAERIGYAELETIYRQHEQWMRDASLDLARGDVGAALSAYDQAGMIRLAPTRQEAIMSLIEDWDRGYDPAKPSLILAHRRLDVAMLNEMARTRLVGRGVIAAGHPFQTEDGMRLFAAGDQIVFLKNEGSLGVKNGMLARVVEADAGRIVAEIGVREDQRQVIVEQRFYANLDHGYATTVHKAQGATVDCVKVLASSTLDRHLTYVAMTRHRKTAELYVGEDEFSGRLGGILLAHGPAPYQHKRENPMSYFVNMRSAGGKECTIWGVDLARALEVAAPEIGDRIGLKHSGSEPILLPDGTHVDRNRWSVQPIRELAMDGLRDCLSRDASKETTLDYQSASSYRQALAFADRRGMHLMRVARTLLRDRLEWTVQQTHRLADLAARLSALGARIAGASRQIGQRQDGLTRDLGRQVQTAKEGEPMLAGLTSFEHSIKDAVNEKLSTDRALKTQWQDVSSRFHMVYADPQAAFAAVDVDGMNASPASAKARLDKISASPESFGTLNGKAGLFAGRAMAEARGTAILNAPALARSLQTYLQKRSQAERRYSAEEQALRLRQGLEIPALSHAARQTLELVRDAVDRNDLPAGLELASADKQVKAELEEFAKAVSTRFGERSFLPIAARDPGGALFDTLSARLPKAQKVALRSAWSTMRTVQQLAAYDRTVQGLRQAEALAKAKAKGLSIQ